MSVFVWVYGEPRHGLGACGAFTPWQVKQETPAPPPEKLFPWQIWQEKKLPSPGALLAHTPCTWGVAHPAIVP